MDTPQPIPNFDESVAQVMQTLPPPIRSYLTQGKYTAVAQSLMAKYGLRIDQGGVLEREIMLLLMGIENPEEFNQALATEANLDQQTVSNIVLDVNMQVFSPLREEMRKGIETFGKKPPQIPTTMPVRQQTAAPLPAPAAGAGQSSSHFHLENKLPPPIRPAESATIRPIPPRLSAQVPVAAAALRTPVPALPQQPSRPAVAPSINIFNAEPKVVPQQSPSLPPRPPVFTIAPLPPKTVLPRPAMTIIPRPMLPIGEQPSAPRSMNMPPRPAAETPLQQALRTVLPRPAVASGVGGPPPPNLPGAMPPSDIMPPARPAPAEQKVSQAPVKPYSADPYREPIE